MKKNRYNSKKRANRINLDGFVRYEGNPTITHPHFLSSFFFHFLLQDHWDGCTILKGTKRLPLLRTGRFVDETTMLKYYKCVGIRIHGNSQPLTNIQEKEE